MIRLSYIGLAAVCLVMASCEREDKGADLDKHNRVAAQPAAYDIGFTTQWSCEDHWITENVIQAVLDLAGSSEALTVKWLSDESYDVTIGENTWPFDSSTSSWDPALYGEMLKSVGYEGVAGEARDLDSFLSKMLDTQEAILEDENQQLSAALEKLPTSAELHNHAAILLGMLAFLEDAHVLTDSRQQLNLMTAHLALSDAAGGGSPRSRLWAQLMLDFHKGHRLKCHTALTELEPTGPVETQFKRGLQVACTGDWRVMETLETPSLFEAIAQVRALEMNHSDEAALAYVANHRALGSTPSWARSLASSSYSVGTGHMLLENWLQLEINGLITVLPVGQETMMEDMQKVLQLDRETGPGGPVRVISQGDWSAYYRRHMRSAVRSLTYFMNKQWGVPDRAKEFHDSLASIFQGLPGEDFVAPLLAVDSRTAKRLATKVKNAVLTRPEETTSQLWFQYRNDYKVGYLIDRLPLPRESGWFRTMAPPGTAYLADRRTDQNPMNNRWPEGLGKLRALDPWSVEVNSDLAHEPTTRSPAQLEIIYGDMVNYSRRAARRRIQLCGDDIEAIIAAYQPLIKFSPLEARNLGFELVLHGRDKEAVEQFEYAFDNSEESVGVTRYMGWTIDYLRKNGRDERAQELADRGAEVYSATGLVDAVNYYAAKGDAEKARELARARDERYGRRGSVELVEWILAGRDVRSLPRSIFSKGSMTASLDSVKTSDATSGMRVMNSSRLSRRYNLHPGTIVLAINGVRVRSVAEYQFMMDSQLDAHYDLIVRRGEHINEMRLYIPAGRLGIDIEAVGGGN